MNSMGNSIGLPELVRGLEWGYLLLWAALVVLALWLPKGRKAKTVASILVLILGSVLPAYLALGIKKRQEERRPVVEKEQAQLKAAMARFEERCKTAGEKIYRTVEDVEGVLLTNVRPSSNTKDWADPNWADAALLPNEPPGDDYIRSFLYWEQRKKNFYGDELQKDQRGYLNHSPSPIPGYRFVDVELQSGVFQRRRLERPESSNLISEPVMGKPTRYAVGFENFIDPEDRKLWVAGTKVTITDTAANELIAETTWYAFEPGQGSTAGFRSPWAFAKTCPSQHGLHGSVTRFFVDRVLKPNKGN